MLLDARRTISYKKRHKNMDPTFEITSKKTNGLLERSILPHYSNRPINQEKSFCIFVELLHTCVREKKRRRRIQPSRKRNEIKTIPLYL